jgi:hypothetical protein
LHPDCAQLAQQDLGFIACSSHDGQSTLLEEFFDLVPGASLSVHDVEEIVAALCLKAESNIPTLIWKTFVIHFVQVLLE